MLSICQQLIQERVAQRRWFTFTLVLHFLQLREMEHHLGQAQIRICMSSSIAAKNLHSYS